MWGEAGGVNSPILQAGRAQTQSSRRPQGRSGNELQLRQEAAKGHVRPHLLAKKVGWEAGRRRRRSMTSPKTFLQTRRGSHLGTTFRKRDDRKHEFCLFPPITWVHMFQTKTHFSKSVLFCSSSCSCLREAPLRGMCSWWKANKTGCRGQNTALHRLETKSRVQYQPQRLGCFLFALPSVLPASMGQDTLSSARWLHSTLCEMRVCSAASDSL